MKNAAFSIEELFRFLDAGVSAFHSTAAASAILEAEARLESAKRDANAQVMLAEASAEAIRRISAAIGDQTGPMSYILGEKYIAALERMGDKENSKLVVLPADLQEAVKGLFGRK